MLRPQPVHATSRTGADLTRILALGGLIGPIMFVTLVIIGGLAYEGYSHASQAISELGGEGSEVAWLQNTNFILFGLLSLAFAAALARSTGTWWPGPALIAVFALSSSIANGLLPCDLGCQGSTTVGLLHNISGVTGFVSAIIGIVLLGRRWRLDPSWAPHARFSRRAATVAALGLIAFIITQAGEIEAIDGIAQRAFVAALLSWVFVTALRLRATQHISG